MSCYFRHMKDVLEEAGIEPTPENKKDVDRIIHGLVEVEYKNCSPAWKIVKEAVRGDEKLRADFVARLRQEWDKQK
ncbi:MAG: hypothetical protein JSV26_03785 [bacterium]|nr:MAG: hypothetical protein JSV26_03785 [bacterium]